MLINPPGVVPVVGVAPNVPRVNPPGVEVPPMPPPTPPPTGEKEKVGVGVLLAGAPNNPGVVVVPAPPKAGVDVPPNKDVDEGGCSPPPLQIQGLGWVLQRQACPLRRRN